MAPRASRHAQRVAQCAIGRLSPLPNPRPTRPLRATGLRTALNVNAKLKAQGLEPRTGVTSGTAFCGLVGSSYRCEYSVMGPSVNLAARLMCECEKKGVELLCNDALHALVTSAGASVPYTSWLGVVTLLVLIWICLRTHSHS